MGQVAVIYRVMPEDISVDMVKLRTAITEAVKSNGKLNEIKEIPIAFGLKALDVCMIFDDKKGGADEAEEKIRGVPGINSVEITHTGLL